MSTWALRFCFAASTCQASMTSSPVGVELFRICRDRRDRQRRLPTGSPVAQPDMSAAPRITPAAITRPSFSTCGGPVVARRPPAEGMARPALRSDRRSAGPSQLLMVRHHAVELRGDVKHRRRDSTDPEHGRRDSTGPGLAIPRHAASLSGPTGALACYGRTERPRRRMAVTGEPDPAKEPPPVEMSAGESFWTKWATVVIVGEICLIALF